MKLVYVRWKDASHDDGPAYMADMEPGIILESAGVLLDKDKDGHLSFAADCWEAFGGQKARHVTHVPHGMIIEMRVIDVGKTPKRRKRK